VTHPKTSSGKQYKRPTSTSAGQENDATCCSDGQTTLDSNNQLPASNNFQILTVNATQSDTRTCVFRTLAIKAPSGDSAHMPFVHWLPSPINVANSIDNPAEFHARLTRFQAQGPILLLHSMFQLQTRGHTCGSGLHDLESPDLGHKGSQWAQPL
jgi:hypothetical protein